MIPSRINKVKLITQHFEATVDTQKRTFTIFGDFRTNNVYTVPGWDDPEQPRILQGLIDELTQLESEIRQMLSGMEVAEDGVFVPYLPEGGV